MNTNQLNFNNGGAPMAKNSIDAYGASGKSNVLFSNRKTCIW